MTYYSHLREYDLILFFLYVGRQSHAQMHALHLKFSLLYVVNTSLHVLLRQLSALYQCVADRARLQKKTLVCYLSI